MKKYFPSFFRGANARNNQAGNYDSHFNKPKHLSLRKEKGSLVFDCLCSLLVIWGLLIVMQQLFRFEDNIFLALLRAVVALGVIVAVSRNKYTLAVTGGVVGVVLMVLWAAESPVFEYVSLFSTWWINKFPTSSALNTKGSMMLAQVVIAFGVSALSFFLIRVVRRFSLLLLLCIGAFGVILFNGFKNNFLGLALFSAGIFPVLAQEYQVYLYKKEEVSKSSPLKIMAASTAVCLVAAILSGLFLPTNTQKFQNKTLKKFVPNFLNSTANRSLSLGDLGLSITPEKLGGNISLNKDLVFEVESEKSQLYRASHYDIYNGKGWESSNDYINQSGNDWRPLPQGKAINTQSLLGYEWLSFDEMRSLSEGISYVPSFFTDILEPADEKNELLKAINETLPTSTADITLAVQTPLLFYPGQPSALSFTNDDDNSLLFNSSGEITAEEGLFSNDSYSVEYKWLNRNHESFEKLVAINKLLKNNASNETGELGASKQLPLRASRHVTAALEDVFEIMNNTQKNSIDVYIENFALLDENDLWWTDYAYAKTIESYLKDNFTYTLTPGAVPDDADFVDHFLVTKKGYCVYFASAMAMMCRSIGIPSRFTVGYGVRQVGETSWTANNDTAHAWVECYIQGVGWVTFDPTASSDFISDDIAVDPAPSEGTKPTTTPLPTKTDENPSTTQPGDTTTKPSDSNKVSAQKRIALVVIIIGVLLLSVLAFVLMRRKSFTLSYIKHKHKNDYRKISDHVYRQVLLQFALMKIKVSTSQTMNEYKETVVTYLTTDDKYKEELPDEVISAVENVFDIMTLCRYSNYDVTENDVDKLYDCYIILDAHLKKKTFVLEYLFKKYFSF